MLNKGILIGAKLMVVGGTVAAGYCYGKIQYYNGRLDAAHEIAEKMTSALNYTNYEELEKTVTNDNKRKNDNSTYRQLDKTLKDYFKGKE